ncbi:DUF1657 domain-containing protein [Virgibacillus siamensis]|uniref:DUF1657 domain-containing protein n=1 Tax=Virgibacillus siamensis TaxID=480071 RepID=UPI0009873924|nr:DUF1657 domain-containing protein [Virgibacillus siamensis]
MTVGSQVKACYASVKSAEATLMNLKGKSNDPQTQEAFKNAYSIMKDIKTDLEKQIIYLSQEEPQYKN